MELAWSSGSLNVEPIPAVVHENLVVGKNMSHAQKTRDFKAKYVLQ